MNLEEFFALDRLVGEGTYGKVFKATVKQDILFPHPMFIKDVDPKKEDGDLFKHVPYGKDPANRIIPVCLKAGTTVALKRIRSEKEGLSVTTAREIRFLQQIQNDRGLPCRHPHLKKCAEIYKTFYDKGKYNQAKGEGILTNMNRWYVEFGLSLSSL